MTEEQTDNKNAPTIDPKTLLQFNATIIVGVLLFLTISESFFDPDPFDWQVMLTVMIIVPFCISSIIIITYDYPSIRGRNARGISLDGMLYWARVFVFGGLLYLVLAMLFIGIQNIVSE